MAWKLAEDWESFDEALERFVRAVTAVADEYHHKTVIVVAHGTVMRTFLIFAGFGTLSMSCPRAQSTTPATSWSKPTAGAGTSRTPTAYIGRTNSRRRSARAKSSRLPRRQDPRARQPFGGVSSSSTNADGG